MNQALTLKLYTHLAASADELCSITQERIAAAGARAGKAGEQALCALAGRTDLSPSAAQRLAEPPSARVRAAYLARPGTSAETLETLTITETRVQVLAAAASHSSVSIETLERLACLGQPVVLAAATTNLSLTPEQLGGLLAAAGRSERVNAATLKRARVHQLDAAALDAAIELSDVTGRSKLAATGSLPGRRSNMVLLIEAVLQAVATANLSTADAVEWVAVALRGRPGTARWRHAGRPEKALLKALAGRHDWAAASCMCPPVVWAVEGAVRRTNSSPSTQEEDLIAAAANATSFDAFLAELNSVLPSAELIEKLAANPNLDAAALEQLVKNISSSTGAALVTASWVRPTAELLVPVLLESYPEMCRSTLDRVPETTAEQAGSLLARRQFSRRSSPQARLVRAGRLALACQYPAVRRGIAAELSVSELATLFEALQTDSGPELNDTIAELAGTVAELAGTVAELLAQILTGDAWEVFSTLAEHTSSGLIDSAEISAKL